MDRSKNNLFLLTATVICIGLSGCLKTRAQAKKDGDVNSGAPAPARVDTVEPEGSYALDEIKAELANQSGRIGDIERQQKEGESDQEKNKLINLETRMGELEATQVHILSQLQKLQTTTAVDPINVFEEGKKEYSARNYKGAVSNFDSYLKSPKAFAHKQESTFLRAESHYKLGNYKKAIEDYSAFPQKYTRSRRMPSALYKIGLSFESLGMKSDASPFYQELIDKFPNSKEAKLARLKTSSKPRPKRKNR